MSQDILSKTALKTEPDDGDIDSYCETQNNAVQLENSSMLSVSRWHRQLIR